MNTYIFNIEWCISVSIDLPTNPIHNPFGWDRNDSIQNVTFLFCHMTTYISISHLHTHPTWHLIIYDVCADRNDSIQNVTFVFCHMTTYISISHLHTHPTWHLIIYYVCADRISISSTYCSWFVGWAIRVKYQ